MKKRFIPLLSILLLTGCIHSRTAAKLPAPPSLEEELAKLRQAGIPTTIEELTLPEIPDEQNGTSVYNEIFKLKDALRHKYKKEVEELLPFQGSREWDKLSGEDKQKVIELILHNSDFDRLYKLLDKATSMQCRFFKKAETRQEAIKESLDFLNVSAYLRSCARDLAEKAKIESEYGDIDKALHSSLTGLLLPKSLSNEPLAIAGLIRIATDAIALNTLREVVNKSGDNSETYRLLINEIRKERQTPLISTGLQKEFAFFTLPLFAHMRMSGEKYFTLTEEEKTEINNVFQNSGMAKQVIEQQQKERNLLRQAYKKSGYKTPQQFFEKQQIAFIQVFSRIISLTEKPYYTVKDELIRIDSEIEQSPEGSFQRRLGGIPSRMYLSEARIDALLGTAEIALANRIYMQKHGTFADDLKQLTPDILPALPLDPFSGRDYIYRKTEKGFIVYSVADNLKDDGGVPQFSKEGKKSGNFDITWEDTGAGIPVAEEKPMSMKPAHGLRKTDWVPEGFPPLDAEPAENGKVEGRDLFVWFCRKISDKTFMSDFYHLIQNQGGSYSGASRYWRYSDHALRDGIIFVYNVETGKTLKLTGTLSKNYDRTTKKWTVSSSQYIPPDLMGKLDSFGLLEDFNIFKAENPLEHGNTRLFERCLGSDVLK